MKKFRIPVQIASRDEVETKKYFVFVREEWKTVRDLEEHLKALFTLENCEIRVDEVILPSLETIDIIEPGDTLTISRNDVKKVRCGISSHFERPAEGGCSLNDVRAQNSVGETQTKRVKSRPQRQRALASSVGHFVELLRQQEPDEPSTSRPLPISPSVDEGDSYTEGHEDAMRCEPEARKRKRKRKRKLRNGDLKPSSDERECATSLGPQHVRFDEVDAEENPRSNLKEDNDPESETDEHPLQRYFKMAKAPSKFKFNRNDPENDNSPPRKSSNTNKQFPPTTSNGLAEPASDSLRSSADVLDLPTQEPPRVKSTDPVIFDLIIPENHAPVSHFNVNDRILFKFKMSETETSGNILGQISDKYVDGLRIDLQEGDWSAVSRERTCYISWENLIDPRLVG